MNSKALMWISKAQNEMLLSQSSRLTHLFNSWGFWSLERFSDFSEVTRLVCCCYCTVAQSCLILCDPTDCSTPGFLVLPCMLCSEFAQTHVHRVNDAIQPSHLLLSPFPPDFNLSQHQGLFQWVGSSHQVAKVLQLQLQHQSILWIFMIDLL